MSLLICLLSVCLDGFSPLKYDVLFIQKERKNNNSKGGIPPARPPKTHLIWLSDGELEGHFAGADAAVAVVVAVVFLVAVIVVASGGDDVVVVASGADDVVVVASGADDVVVLSIVRYATQAVFYTTGFSNLGNYSPH
ncbi:uncharacterized protein ARB_02333 [Trichophyton benhamiae CBS 112371]|uniref:Uncharacterized protein n=1 Tax=Arthroderma benhamiae (strain ATCC MYA-4681 / CBS 112371) TaxID=663331 RepID=D4B1K4_ARTBC|nr:uncharacterized protein ARB_02333 [Trichophyton benhamiae CBS 112371]EFE30843.1 hypothetical protein ARB_02333 [Trichophyton benhamiae CBS 112371]